MSVILPSGEISLSQIKSSLNSTNNSLLGFRGMNQTLPSSGAISMSNAQRLVKGVGYSSNYYTPIYNTLYGTWNQTAITNLNNMTVSFFINITNTNGNWRNVFHVTPAIWITPNTTQLHIKSDTTHVNNEGDDTGAIGLNTTTHVTK